MRYAQSILDIIEHSDAHLTAEEIFFTLKQAYPAVVLATVYNNLNSLHQKGKIRKLSLEGCPDRYDRNTRHNHLLCSKCGALSDVYLEDLTQPLQRQTGLEIQGYDLMIRYVCPDCRAKAAAHKE